MCRELFTDVLGVVAAIPGFPVFGQGITALVQVKGKRHRDMAAAHGFQAGVRDLIFLIKRPSVTGDFMGAASGQRRAGECLQGDKAAAGCIVLLWIGRLVMGHDCLMNSGLFVGERRGRGARLHGDWRRGRCVRLHRNTFQTQHGINVVDVFRIFHLLLRDHVTGNGILPRDHKNIVVLNIKGGQNQRHFLRCGALQGHFFLQSFLPVGSLHQPKTVVILCHLPDIDLQPLEGSQCKVFRVFIPQPVYFQGVCL